MQRQLPAAVEIVEYPVLRGLRVLPDLADQRLGRENKCHARRREQWDADESGSRSKSHVEIMHEQAGRDRPAVHPSR